MATTAAANQPRTRGSGRGATSARARSHQRGPRHAGRGGASRRDHHNGPEELSTLERTAHKFCQGLYGCVRQEPVHGPATDLLGILAGDLEWLVVPMDEDRYPLQPDVNDAWRHMRGKLEAVSVLSVLACTESYAWRRNFAFWRRFTETQQQDQSPGPRENRGPRRVLQAVHTTSIPAARDDTILPRFMLDFSFVEITVDVVTLLRHVLLGSDKSMRQSFRYAMETLATIPQWSPRAASIPIALRFARCQLRGNDLIRMLVELVGVVNRACHDRQRELSNATSRAFYYDIVELDLSSLRLSASDLNHLRRLQVAPQQSSFRLVLDNAINASTDEIIAFGSTVSSWFDPKLPTEPDHEPEPGSAIDAPSASSTGMTVVSLNSSALSPHHVASLFSAIAATGRSATSRLSLRGALQLCDPRVAWAWITFGVLSDQSVSKLESLDLSRNVLRLEDAAIVRQVITASDQATRAQLMYRLMNGTTAQIHSQLSKKNRRRRKSGKNHQDQGNSEPMKDVGMHRSWVRLDAGTKLAVSVPGKVTNLRLTSCIVVRVVEARSSTNAAVLVPGYGFLEANLSDATSVKDIPELIPAEKQLHELKLNSMTVPEDDVQPDAVFEALFSSLSLVSLTKLELNGNPLAQGALRAILAACPFLNALSLEDCELPSISAIIEAYSRGVCHIKSLNLTENEVGDRDIVDLCRLIARESSPASQLRLLNLHLNPISHRGLHALSAAVRESPHALAHLVLDKDQDPDAQFRPVFYPLQDQFLGIEPLSDAHQREFHDALARRLRTIALEPSILARIHTYAGTTVHRRIVWM